MKQFDFIVLGSGIAGLSFALKIAPRLRADSRQAARPVTRHTHLALAVFVGKIG